ncbi:MAG: tetratricopeptide repeat protein [Gemmatimonadota bacterium]|nr:tetratricopeptide repeat protein [Gemmatimonadota bacterium]MDE3215017.1 tetratricopeptide repeat protein [Gemmatimonadota bacterium]
MQSPERRVIFESGLAAGEAAEDRGDYVQAAALYTPLTEERSAEFRAEGLFRLGRVSWRQGRFEQAVAFYEDARTAARSAGRRDLEARAENGIGIVHYSRGEYAQARAAYQVAMERTTDPVLIGRFMLNMGVISNIEGNLDNALWHYMRARALFRDNGDRPSEALALQNLGMIYADRQEWEASADMYDQCLGLCEWLGNRPMVAKVLLNQTEVLVARGEFERAVHGCELSMSISVEVGDEVERGEAFRWQGYAFRKAGRFDDAELALKEALRVAQRFRVKLLEAEVSREFWHLKRAAQDGEAAERWRAKALDLFRQLGADREVAAMEREPAPEA